MKLDPNTIAANLNAAAAAEAEAAAADPQTIQLAPGSSGLSTGAIGTGPGASGAGTSGVGVSNAAKAHYPRDVQVIQVMLKEQNIHNYDKRVVSQILDFAYRYIQNVLEDAELLSSYAKKKAVDADDIQLSINFSSDRTFVGPPSREELIEISKQRNYIPLPAVRTHSGMRLPTDRYSLVSANVSMNSKKDSM